MKKRFDDFIAGGGTAEEFDLPRKVHKRQSNSKGPMLVEELRNTVDTEQVREVNRHRDGHVRAHSEEDNA